MEALRWNRCVSHQGTEAEEFLSAFFSDSKRRILLVGGAGFDPRTRRIPELLASVGNRRLHATLLREERPSPSQRLVDLAEGNLEQLASVVASLAVETIPVFASDRAVVGGRSAAKVLDTHDLTAFTDVVVDATALSVGIVFPVVRFLLSGLTEPDSPNLHLTVVDSPQVDYAIRPTASDRVSFVEGFKNRFARTETADSARLWIPNLREDCTAILARVLEFVAPHMVCPILPFPARDPRRSDLLLAEYRREFEDAWAVDPRQIIYADESDPLNLYRTILRIDSVRSRVFEKVGGALTILTPTASKLLNLGALMAAIERDFPVVYVEALGYDLDGDDPIINPNNERTTHIWLHGEAYRGLAN